MSDIIEALEITALTHGGRGIGRYDGKAVFVPLTAPGDQITCRVLREKKNFIEAELVEVASTSTARRNPPCPYFGQCGGCQWQHLPYQQQLFWKERVFADQLVRNGTAGHEVILPIVPSGDEWNYRNRVQFKCHQKADGMVIGYYRHGSHFVIDVAVCKLLAPQIQSVYKLLRDELPGCSQPASIPQVDVAVGDNDVVRVVLHVLPEARKEVSRWLVDFAGRNNLNACIQSGRKNTIEMVSGEPHLLVSLDQPQLHLKFGPGGFAQVNSSQNRKMIHEMLSRLELGGTETVLDLFCGMGNFSLPLATMAAQVVGVEDYAPSIEAAKQNAIENHIDNVDFYVADAASFVNRFKPGHFDLIVLDPPRSGNYQVAKEILRLKPQQVLYVSCDPATLARDLKPLVHSGYEVVSAQPFDLFPQTWHIESMTLLRRLEDKARG